MPLMYRDFTGCSGAFPKLIFIYRIWRTLLQMQAESMKVLAWARQYKNARVFCCQSGHDNQVFADPNFRTVIARGIQWLAGRI